MKNYENMTHTAFMDAYHKLQKAFPDVYETDAGCVESEFDDDGSDKIKQVYLIFKGKVDKVLAYIKATELITCEISSFTFNDEHVEGIDLLELELASLRKRMTKMSTPQCMRKGGILHDIKEVEAEIRMLQRG